MKNSNITMVLHWADKNKHNIGPNYWDLVPYTTTLHGVQILKQIATYQRDLMIEKGHF